MTGDQDMDVEFKLLIVGVQALSISSWLAIWDSFPVSWFRHILVLFSTFIQPFFLPLGAKATMVQKYMKLLFAQVPGKQLYACALIHYCKLMSASGPWMPKGSFHVGFNRSWSSEYNACQSSGNSILNYIAPYSNQIIDLLVKKCSQGTCLLRMLTISVQVLLPWMGHYWLYVWRCAIYNLNNF